MKVNYSPPSVDDYINCFQIGGGVPVYSGSILQRGYGIGGLFRSLASGLIPLLPKLGRTLAKTAATTALGVAADKFRGVPLSRSIKTRGLETGRKLLI